MRLARESRDEGWAGIPLQAEACKRDVNAAEGYALGEWMMRSGGLTGEKQLATENTEFTEEKQPVAACKPPADLGRKAAPRPLCELCGLHLRFSGLFVAWFWWTNGFAGLNNRSMNET